MKIFIDANVLVAACGNATGGSAYVFKVASADPTWHLITSGLVLTEARTNVHKKLPTTISTFEALILLPGLTVVYDPPAALIEAAARIINPKDSPILAAAIAAKANYLCTLDRKDFHTKAVKTWCKRFNLTSVTPGELLMLWRNHQTSNEE